jgi:hypothetical protein
VHFNPPLTFESVLARKGAVKRMQVFETHKRTNGLHSRVAATRGLTLPSRGRATSGFAGCRPPLMSNVRPRGMAFERTGTMAAINHRSGSLHFSSSGSGVVFGHGVAHAIYKVAQYGGLVGSAALNRTLAASYPSVAYTAHCGFATGQCLTRGRADVHKQASLACGLRSPLR